MKNIKIFNLLEKSFISLRHTNKKIWIIGIIIAILSGGLNIYDSSNDYFSGDSDYDYSYTNDENNIGLEDEIYQENGYITGEEFTNVVDDIFTFGLGAIIMFVIVILALVLIIAIILGLLISVANYYLQHSICEILSKEKIERAPLGLVIKVNFIVLLKVTFGLILFVIPGVIIGLKYAPVNYIMCKNPELSYKEVLKNAKELSKGFKWKMFVSNLLIGTIAVVVILLCSLSVFAPGYILIDFAEMILTLALSTFATVFSGLYNIHLFNAINDFKNPVNLEF
ncbi:DUF975 family protein [[Clostridium] dakarense]|uniref:DUF975 family protein n=1 Tax=Faecalimicrobium dakarense TaxID=1301100 RepID=UPI0004BC2C27|nr:DUF975 family protein [[Clostridium] dakarense]